MATNFPTSLDSYTDKVDGTDYPQAAHINNPQDAIEALEAKVGVDSSAVSSSLDYIIKNTTSGHDHDGSDSKKVIATNLNVTGLTVSQLLRVNSGGTAVESSGKTVPTGDIVGTSDSQVLTTKTLTSPVINTSVSGTAILDEDTMSSNSDTKLATQQSIKAYVDAIKASLMPIGTIYENATDATNPATLFGFGTWTLLGAGRMTVCLDSGDTDFDTAEETGGSKTATIAQANLPNISTGAGTAHTHTQNAHGHTVQLYGDGDAGAGAYNANSNNSGPSHTVTAANTTATNQNESAHTHPLGGSGTALSIQNKYIVIYRWKRTA